MPNEASIFSAEAYAIKLALNFISKNKGENYIIFSDSLSVLTSLKGKRLENPLIQSLLYKLHSMEKSKNIIFCWIPSHVGIQGGDKADNAAKSSLKMTIDENLQIPYTDLKSKIYKYIRNKWQNLWKNQTGNKLFQIKPKIGKWGNDLGNTRKKQVVITRTHIGHTYLTHSHILKKTNPPKCRCGSLITIRHILSECKIITRIRQKYLNGKDLKEIFKNTDTEKIYSFLKEIKILNKI